MVTMSVTHVNSFVFELELTGFDATGRAVCETLCPTNVHKLFSATRNDWVMTQDLRVGEALRTQSGLSTITGVRRKAGDQRVYNFEVEATHAYYVGQTRTLSHNMGCAVTKGAGGELPHNGIRPYEVGSADDLYRRQLPYDDLDVHHAPQALPAQQVIPGYTRETGPAIALPFSEHRMIPKSSGPYPGTPRDLLARDLKNLRTFTKAPNSAVKQLSDLTKCSFPGSFTKP